jgi:hypothetical protein
MRPALLALLTLGIAGCASRDWSKEPLDVSVSAANYSELPRAQLYLQVNGSGATNPSPPAPPVPSAPIFYGLVPGEIYDSDVPLETVYRELAVALAHRGYFNVVYQAEAGLLPKRVDYLLRVHCGVRPWAIPTVRVDHVTWGDSGLISNVRDPRSSAALLLGPGANPDPRAGQDPADAVNLAMLMQTQGSATRSSFATQGELYASENLSHEGARRDFCLVVVEAFRFDDVWKKKNGARCVWATFIAVPLHSGQEFSSMLRTMVHTATPYFGTTTNGLQVYEVPAGKVLMGEPVEVPGQPKAPPPTGQASP